MAGVNLNPADTFTVGVDAVWTASDAGTDVWDLAAPTAVNANQSWDFSNAHLYSALDMERLDLGVTARLKLAERFWVTGSARRADFDDDSNTIEYEGETAYLLPDSSGELEYYALALGWSF